MKRFSLKKCLISTVLASVMGFQTVLPAVHAEEEYGVDVSRYQGNINWDQIKNDGMSFVILRAGTTRYGIDSEFEKYYEGTRKAGIKTGAYLYISSMSLEEFKAAAEQFMTYLEGKQWEMPVYIDLEENEQTTLGKQTLTTYALACMNILSDAGYKTGIYSNLNWYRNFLDKDQIDKAGYEIWYAQYPEAHADPHDYDKSDMCRIWQYSSQGSISSIPENAVDLNIAYHIYDERRAVNGAGEPWMVPFLGRKTMKAGPGNEYGDILNVPQNTVLNMSEIRYEDGTEWGKFSYGGYVGWCDLYGMIDFSAEGVPEDPYMYYDVNLDGTVNAADELALVKYILCDNTDGLSADLNGDGNVNVFDRMRLMAYIINAEG